jgi:hypothetical protein
MANRERLVIEGSIHCLVSFSGQFLGSEVLRWPLVGWCLVWRPLRRSREDGTDALEDSQRISSVRARVAAANRGDPKADAAEGQSRVAASVSVGTTTALCEPSNASLRYSGLV